MKNIVEYVFVERKKEQIFNDVSYPCSSFKKKKSGRTFCAEVRNKHRNI